MIHLVYKDFTEAYKGITRFPLKEIKNEDFFDIGGSLYANDLIVETNSSNLEGAESDLGNFNYTKVKWTTLLKKYIDNDDYFLLKKRLIESTCKTLTFNFKIHKNSAEKDKTWIKTRDSCLIALVFKRNRTKGFWIQATVFWRSTEIFQKFAVDLMLLNRMFNDLPNLNLEKIYLHFSQCFWSSFKLCELIDSDLFTIEEFKNSTSFVAKKLYTHYLRYYGPEAELSNYHAIRRKQEAKLSGKKNISIPLETLTMPEEPIQKEMDF